MKPFERIVIIGLGLIGGSIALSLRRTGFKGKIVGIDDHATISRAREANAIDEGLLCDRLEVGFQAPALVMLCTPISTIIELLRKIAPLVLPGSLVTDVGSTKRRIVEFADQQLPPHCDFIGGHPLAGAETSGFQSADPFLFENATYVLTPSRLSDEQRRVALGRLLESIGANVLLLSPNAHDRIAAHVSHLPQMAAVALMNMVAALQVDNPYLLKIAAGGFRDMTRVAASPYRIWADICATNRDEINLAIDRYVDALRAIQNDLNADGLAARFLAAAQHRQTIPKDSRGLLTPQFDILVAVNDRPGMLAKIATALAAKQINIRDIEVLKARENEGGTFRLAFSSAADRSMAISTLEADGFICRVRR